MVYAERLVTSPSLNAPLLSLPASVWLLFCLLLFLGDESGYEMGDVQKTKLAALKPSGKRNLRLLPLLCWAFLIRKRRRTNLQIQIPYALGVDCNAFRGYPGYRPERADGAAWKTHS